MNFFTKKNFMFKLIVCICLFLTLLNFMGSSKVYADDDSGVGGVLINPICKLLCALGDGVMNILQEAVIGADATISVDNSDSEWYESVWVWIVGAVVVAAVIFITVTGSWAVVGAALLKAAKWLALHGGIAEGIKALLAIGVTVMVFGGEAVSGAVTTVKAIASDTVGSTLVLPMYSIGPEEIFSGKILLFDANIFNPKTLIKDNENEDLYYYQDGEERVYTSKNNTAAELKDIVSKWYYIIRNIALVGSMLTLLYVGIRMMLSSVAEQKAKYKQMLSDWIIAICLIVLMHYIMAFAHSFTESVTKILNNISDNSGVYLGIIANPNDHLLKAVEDIEESTGKTYINKEDEDNKYITWPTNMMGIYRIASQQTKDNMEHVGYTLAYLTLVIFTLAFSLTYIKRALWLLFLTVISPFVALTYPLDKINDGKAQAFDMWLKEYVFNLLIQPFHLLLYTIFVTMAFELSSSNIIYSLVVLGFMMPAEKFLRTMFGFNKASSPGMLGGATGAALTMSAMGALKKFGGKPGGPGGHGADGKGQGKEENKNLRTNDPDKTQQSLIDDIAKENDVNNNDKSSDGNSQEDNEKNKWAEAEKNAYEEFYAEGASDDNGWTDEDYAAFDELEEEYLEKYGSKNDNNSADGVEETVEQESASQNQDIPNTDDSPQYGLRDRLASFKNSKAGRIIGASGKAAWRIAKPAAGKALRFTANAATAATLGGIGVAAGIASGDINAVTKNAGIGVSAGVSLSNGVIKRTSDRMKNNTRITNEAVDSWKKDYYGKDYEQKMREEQDEKFMKDRETRKLYKEKLKLKNKAEIDKAMADAVKYREYGVTDDKKIIKAMKMNNGNENNRADKKRIAAAKFAENTKNEKDLESHLKRFGESKGITEKQVKEMKDMVRIINNM